MLELGPKAEAMHAELAADLSANRVDLLFGAGPLTRALFDAAPASMRAAWAERSNELTSESPAPCAAATSRWSKAPTAAGWVRCVAALRDRFAHAARDEDIRC